VAPHALAITVFSNVRNGSVAVVHPDFSPMTALERIADAQDEDSRITRARMSALTNTGRSEPLRKPEINGSYRPEAAIRFSAMTLLRN
jgi:hypothetical protein